MSIRNKIFILIISVFVLIGLVYFAGLVFFGGENISMQISQEAVVNTEEISGMDNDQEKDVELETEVEMENGEVENNSKEKTVESIENSVVIEDEEDGLKSEKEDESDFNIKNKLVSFGFSSSSGRKIDTIILHSSFNSLGEDEYDVNKIVDIYKSYGVSAHYIIGRDGTIYRLVDEKNISYHAGVSSVPDGRNNVNNFSIGIEIVGNFDDGYTKDQYNAVKSLIKDIKSRYEIKYVLGHDDVAPGRKTDPWNFDWDKVNY